MERRRLAAEKAFGLESNTDSWKVRTAFYAGVLAVRDEILDESRDDVRDVVLALADEAQEAMEP
jgi:hypothetical protein